MTSCCALPEEIPTGSKAILGVDTGMFVRMPGKVFEAPIASLGGGGSGVCVTPSTGEFDFLRLATSFGTAITGCSTPPASVLGWVAAEVDEPVWGASKESWGLHSLRVGDIGTPGCI